MLNLIVEGMTCEHCNRAVTGAVSPVPGVLGGSVDLGACAVRAQGEADPAAIRHAITEEAYTVR